MDPFNQCGVELGKVLAVRILPELDDHTAASPLAHDSSTIVLIRFYPQLKRGGETRQ